MSYHRDIVKERERDKERHRDRDYENYDGKRFNGR
jgi:hypothetical protein